MLKSQGLNLNLVGYSTFVVKFLVDFHVLEGTSYMVSDFRCRVHDLEVTGFLISRVWGT